MIKKFTQYINESDNIDISSDKVKEIGSTLQETAKNLELEKNKIEQLIKYLESFISDGNKNDQIDDSYVSIKEIESHISEAIVKIDEVNYKMSDYLKIGREYLY